MGAEAEVDAVAALREQLDRHPPDRRPLQHATAQFHLGTVYLERDALREAEDAFSAAAALFAARGARAEQAKALNGLGATLRAAGRLELAARALEHAAAGLSAARLALEEGAARYNLGLVLREADQPGAAGEALARAAELLDPDQVPAQACAALRELGTLRLELGDPAAAEAALVEAIALADRAGDLAARGAAANTLGLARLAADRPAESVEALETAVGSNPRSMRPELFAMAKANLALAHERAEAPAPARLAARQALAAPAVPDAVRDQAAAVLERLGAVAPDDLRAVLEQADDDGRARVAREELARTADADAPARAAAMREWLRAHLDSELEPVAVSEVWLGGLLELPPEVLEELAAAAVRAANELDPEPREHFRAAVSRGMARFHVPQMMRLQDVFSQAAAEAGAAGSWR